MGVGQNRNDNVLNVWSREAAGGGEELIEQVQMKISNITSRKTQTEDSHLEEAS